MIKPDQKKMEYEKLDTKDWVVGVIDDIDYEKEHAWKPYLGQEREPSPAIRFKFLFEGYKYPHKSKWMRLSYAQKSTLYSEYISQLVEKASPFMDFDLEQLKGLKVKTMWVDNEEFQNLKMIVPVSGKVKPLLPQMVSPSFAKKDDDEVPF